MNEPKDGQFLLKAVKQTSPTIVQTNNRKNKERGSNFNESCNMRMAKEHKDIERRDYFNESFNTSVAKDYKNMERRDKPNESFDTSITKFA